MLVLCLIDVKLVKNTDTNYWHEKSGRFSTAFLLRRPILLPSFLFRDREGVVFPLFMAISTYPLLESFAADSAKFAPTGVLEVFSP